MKTSSKSFLQTGNKKKSSKNVGNILECNMLNVYVTLIFPSMSLCCVRYNTSSWSNMKS